MTTAHALEGGSLIPRGTLMGLIYSLKVSSDLPPPASISVIVQGSGCTAPSANQDAGRQGEERADGGRRARRRESEPTLAGENFDFSSV